MYLQLNCEHCLIQPQDGYDRPPRVPGLTVVGFERWMTEAILTFPEIEYNRLSKALLQLPLNNPYSHNRLSKKGIPRDHFPVYGKISQVFTRNLTGGTRPIYSWSQGRDIPRRNPPKVRFVDDEADNYDQSKSGGHWTQGRRTKTVYRSTTLPSKIVA